MLIQLVDAILAVHIAAIVRQHLVVVGMKSFTRR
jgi:hypothetical protein